MPSEIKDLNFGDLKVASTLSLLTVHLSFTGPGFVAISMQMVTVYLFQDRNPAALSLDTCSCA
jgi:hypothetical protein